LYISYFHRRLVFLVCSRRPADADQGAGKQTYIDEDEINALFADMLIPEKELIAAVRLSPSTQAHVLTSGRLRLR
jgi:hypothetical protein